MSREGLEGDAREICERQFQMFGVNLLICLWLFNCVKIWDYEGLRKNKFYHFGP